MPLCRIETNLTSAEVPADFEFKMVKLLAQVLTKPEENISVIVRTDQRMCRGQNREPVLTMQLWSLNVFSPAQNPTYAPKIFELFHQELPTVTDKRITILFHALEAHDIGRPQP